MKKLKGYTAYFTDYVGIDHCYLMNAYYMDEVISEVKRVYGNVRFYSITCGAPHGKSN